MGDCQVWGAGISSETPANCLLHCLPVFQCIALLLLALIACGESCWPNGSLCRPPRLANPAGKPSRPAVTGRACLGHISGNPGTCLLSLLAPPKANSISATHAVTLPPSKPRHYTQIYVTQENRLITRRISLALEGRSTCQWGPRGFNPFELSSVGWDHNSKVTSLTTDHMACVFASVIWRGNGASNARRGETNVQ